VSATQFECQQCGTTFSLSEATLAKYPNWVPKACMQCRESPKAAAASNGGRKRGSSVTRTNNLSTTEILARFDSGPDTGIFTDGSCQGNPGPGGWGAVHVRNGEVIEQRHGFEPMTTNNRMELAAMIAGLEMAGVEEAITVYSDSRLVVETVTSWAKGWEARGWKRKEGEVKNLDLVQRAYALANQRPLANITWIRAHDGSRWNEYADALSTAHLRDTV
jgi:ribonuclease HI